MTSTTSGSPAPAAPTPPIFSYAQAAKGRSATTAAPVLSNQPTSGISTPAKDSNSTINTPSASVNGTTTGSEGGDRSSHGGFDTVTKADPLGVGLESESKSSTLVNSGSIPASPSFGTASTTTLPKDEDLTLSTPVPLESVWDRNSQPTNGAEKHTEPVEGRRGKKGKKQKNAEKEAEREAEKEAEKQKEEEKKLLVAAPPPAVNIWQQRKEAQALKAKPSPPITQNPQAFIEATSTSEHAAKPSESKRKGKSTVADDGEKTAITGQPGGAKDLSNTTKGQKKGSEGAAKGKEETSSKRANPRGSRVSEKEEKPVVSQLPPPVEDAISWPTPETALEEEKRKALEKEKSEKDKEREERDDTASNKPRPKEKWVAVPYVPSVNFNTPLPTRGRGGRGGTRGGRDGAGRGSHTTNGGSNGERANNTSTTAASPAGESETRGRGGSTGARAASLPPNSSKRPSSDTRPQGKPSTGPNGEKSKAGQSTVSVKNESGLNADIQHTATTQIDQSLEAQPIREDITKGEKSEHAQLVSNENISRAGAGDRRSEPNPKGSDQFKEGANFTKEPNQARDGRAERGRGGFRGRGGHNAFPNGQLQQQSQQLFTNGHGPQPPNGYPPRQNSNPYSPSMQQPPFSQQYAQQAPTRGGRGGSRSQSIPNNSMYGRFPSNINSQMPPLQTPYDYQPQPLQTMSAGPFNSSHNETYWGVVTMVTMQFDYYFSIDNLCKDVYLRKHMDSQGFVFLAFIAGFKRIQALTQSTDLLRFACQENPNIDVVRGDDGIDRLRRKDGWENWVLPIDERDESVKTNGPSFFQVYPSQQEMAMMPPPPPYLPEPRFPPRANGFSPVPVTNGNGGNQHPESQISPSAPNFVPGASPSNGTAAVDPLEVETTFNDEDVANLKLVFASPKSNDGPKAGVPFHNSSSRTFSNGSIDSRSIAEEIHEDLRQGRGLTNGSRASETSPDSLRRSRSPFVAPLSPTNSNINNAPTVMWAKGQRQQAIISKDNTDELYTTVRARALRNRELTAPGETHPDMKLLYEFWSHFLCRNFNPKMYQEFRKYANEDASANAMDGIKNLISYYDETLNNKKKVIPEVLALHYVDLVKEEKQRASKSSSDRPAFTKLRASWRNGALDMKSRKKIQDLVDQELKSDLER